MTLSASWAGLSVLLVRLTALSLLCEDFQGALTARISLYALVQTHASHYFTAVKQNA